MPVDSTYAPQSPDLSSFLSGSPSKPSTTNSNQPLSTGYTPQSPKFLPGNFSSPSNPPHFGSISSTSYQPPISLSNLPQNTYQPRTYGNFDYSAGPQSYLPPIPDLPLSHDFGANAQRNTSSFSQTQQLSHSYTNRQSFSASSAYVPQPSFYGNLEQHKRPQSSSSSSDEMSGRGGRKKRENGAGAGMILKNEPEDNAAGIATMSVSAGPSQGIEVKTKFPVARIKRIMQADEEVGKVAQVTPHAVSKALELFMISLVTKSSSLARNGNSKRVTATHLKKAIEGDEQFDFLNEIVSRIAEAPQKEEKEAKPGRGKKEKEESSDSDEEMEDVTSKGTARGGRGGARGKGRRKRGGD